MHINIRHEEEQDYRKVEEINREAFWNLQVQGCDEHYLAHKIRTHPDFIPELDHVAEVDDKVVGSIMYTRSWVTDEEGNKFNTLTFGPLVVLPEYQRKGVGRALLTYTKKLALEMGEKAIIILGHPHNYCCYGFKNCIDFNVSSADGKYPLGQLILELEKGFFAGKKWKFDHSAGYEIDPVAAEEFDKQFPPKKKEYRTSQEEFSIAVRATLS